MKKQRLKTKCNTGSTEVTQEADIRQAVLQLVQCFLHEKPFLIEDTLDVNHFWKSLEEHGLGGLAGKMAMQGQINNTNLKQLAEARYMSNLLNNERVNRVVNRVADICIKENISVSMLKGPALMQQAYRDQGLRGFGDIDLFFESRADLLKITKSLPLQKHHDKGRSSLMHRLRNPGKLDIVVDGIEIEMMNVPSLPTDGMQNTLQWNHPYEVPDSEDSIYNPDPSFHFVFLVLHMLINHLCARLIWFVDLIILYREQQSRINWSWVEQEFERLQMKNVASAIIRFCQQILDPDFHTFKSSQTAWNTPFVDYMLQPDTILSRRLGIQYASHQRKRLLALLNTAGFYLNGDPQHWKEMNSLASQHITNRFLYMINAQYLPLARLCSPVSYLLVWPFARLSIYHFQKVSARPNTKYNTQTCVNE
jgi:hypothetical protein